MKNIEEHSSMVTSSAANQELKQKAFCSRCGDTVGFELSSRGSPVSTAFCCRRCCQLLVLIASKDGWKRMEKGPGSHQTLIVPFKISTFRTVANRLPAIKCPPLGQILSLAGRLALNDPTTSNTYNVLGLGENKMQNRNTPRIMWSPKSSIPSLPCSRKRKISETPSALRSS